MSPDKINSFKLIISKELFYFILGDTEGNIR